MRRLFTSVAVAAATLLAPSAALATVAPGLSGPASPTNAATIDLSWNDVRPLPPAGSVTYQVQRAPLACGVAVTADFAAVGAPLVDQFTYSDPSPADGTYCYRVEADDGLTGTADSNGVQIAIDRTGPVLTAITQTGGNGCAPFTVTGATPGTDSTPPVTYTVDSTPVQGPPYTPVGAPFTSVPVTVTATDALGNVSTITTAAASSLIYDPNRPPAPALEVSTDTSLASATLSWTDPPGDGAPVIAHHLRTKGPQGTSPTNFTAGETMVTVPISQVDATYEFSLTAADVCGDGAATVRLVRLNDTSPPTMPIVAGPVLDPVTHQVTLSWVAATDNIQVDHYEILRNGVPLGATDATTFTDTAPLQHALLSYVVRAVDTNGNATDSAPALITTPDWQAPTAPDLNVSMSGSTATLRWSAATDNIGVVGYDVLRDGKQLASMTAAVRTYKDANVPVGNHTWQVRARDDAGLSAISDPQSARVAKSTSRASVLATRLAGTGRGGARISVKAQARLLVDLRVVGTVSKAKLRLYVRSGRAKLTVWRGTPGSSAPRLRIGSGLARRGFVSISLKRALHAGRIRLVVIPAAKVVVAGAGAHKPAMKS